MKQKKKQMSTLLNFRDEREKQHLISSLIEWNTIFTQIDFVQREAFSIVLYLQK